MIKEILAIEERRSSGAVRPAVRVVVLLLVPGVLAVIAGVVATGAAAPSPFADPGAGVRWGLPLARLVGDLAAGLTLGLLLLAAFVLSPPPDVSSQRPRRARPAALYGACAAGVVWTLASLAGLVLGFAAGTGQGLRDPGLGTQIESYVTQVDAGRWAVVGVAVSALVATLAAGATRARTAAVLAVLAVAALGAQVLSDDAGTPGGTVIRTVLAWLHATAGLGAVGVIGGLLLVPGARQDLAGARQAPPLAWGLAVLAVSGLAAAGLPAEAHPRTAPTWALLAAKVLALAVLAVVSWRGVRRTRPAAGDPALLASVLATGAVAVGVSVAVAITR